MQPDERNALLGVHGAVFHGGDAGPKSIIKRLDDIETTVGKLAAAPTPPPGGNSAPPPPNNRTPPAPDRPALLMARSRRGKTRRSLSSSSQLAHRSAV
ncbi:hypothetical protein [Saccharopolyspora sp. NPDC002376]